MIRLTVLAALLLATAPAYATSLKCENPGGYYLVVVTPTDAVIDPDSFNARMAIIGRIHTKDIGALVLRTQDPAVTEILHLWPEPKMEVFSDGQLAQTDYCEAI